MWQLGLIDDNCLAQEAWVKSVEHTRDALDRISRHTSASDVARFT